MVIKEKIEDLDSFQLINSIERHTYETQSYMNILTYLIDKHIKNTDENFQYYEGKYLESYFKMQEEKADFQRLLQDKYNLKNRNFTWYLDFKLKEVDITIDDGE